MCPIFEEFFVHKWAIFRRLSDPSATLEAIGQEVELTRERVRQIVRRFENRFSGIFDKLQYENYWIAEKLFLVHAFIWSYSCFTSFKNHTLSATDQLEQRYGLEKGTINLWVKLIDTLIERIGFDPFRDYDEVFERAFEGCYPYFGGILAHAYHNENEALLLDSLRNDTDPATLDAIKELLKESKEVDQVPAGLDYGYSSYLPRFIDTYSAHIERIAGPVFRAKLEDLKELLEEVDGEVDLPYLNLTSDNRVVPEVPWVPEIVLKSFDSRSVIPASELLANLYGSNGGSRLVPANIYYAVGHLVQKYLEKLMLH